MIETKVEISKDLEEALQALEQAKQRIANKAQGGRMVTTDTEISCKFYCK